MRETVQSAERRVEDCMDDVRARHLEPMSRATLECVL